MVRSSKVLGLMACLLATSASAQVSTPRGLMRAGPVNPANGFPRWYAERPDSGASTPTGEILELCLDPTDLCLAPPIPDPQRPVTFPDNFPDEAFWWAAEAQLTLGANGRARVVMALEAAFRNGAPAVGDQVSFARVRIRLSNLVPLQAYKVIHPYAEETVIAEADGTVFITQDIGIGAPGDFSGALGGAIGPFLRWTTGAPAGTLGDPTTLHVVTGSPLGTNFVQIQGPRIANPGFLCPQGTVVEPGHDCVHTALFAVMGKRATVMGLTPVRATAIGTPSPPTPGAVGARVVGSATGIDLFLISGWESSVEAIGTGFAKTALRREGDRFYGRLLTFGGFPSTVTVINRSDQPNTVVIVPVVDQVVGSAIYNVDEHRLEIQATSNLGESLIVTVGEGQSWPLVLEADGVQRISVAADAPPPSVEVRSGRGGSSLLQVVGVGGSVEDIAVVARVTASPAPAPQGAPVLLSGTDSEGTIVGFRWTQVDEAGQPIAPTVELLDADTPVAVFVAPEEGVVGPGDETVLHFRLTVQGVTGALASASVSVPILGMPPPVARAGADQVSDGVNPVTVVAEESPFATSYTWEFDPKDAVVDVTLGVREVAFRFPPPESGIEVVTVRLRVTGVGGSMTDTMQVFRRDTIVPGSIRAEFRADKAEWRVAGLVSVFSVPNTVTIAKADCAADCDVGSAVVDTVGAWEFRARGSTVTLGQGQRIDLRSSLGGRLDGVVVTVKN